MSVGDVVPAVLAALAVVVVLPPGGPTRHRVPPSTAGRVRRRGGPVTGWHRARAPAPDPTAALAAAVVAVAAELRAGRSPADAWRAGADVPVGADGVPAERDLLAAVGAPASRPAGGAGRGRSRGRGGSPPRPLAAAQRRALTRRVHAVRAATRLAGELGAPLAGVLEQCARSLQADADAETAVRGALAGPQQTTRLLTWLPVLGLLLGGLLGARPHAVLLDGGLGSLAGVAGLLSTLAGRVWVARMVAGAREARGHPGGPRGRGRG